jgi:hypothetical protein
MSAEPDRKESPTVTDVLYGGELVPINTLKLYELHDIIVRDWAKPNYAAVPYLDAMRYVEDLSTPYGADTGRDIVLYFLSNATSWRGDTAKAVRAELKRRLGR